MNILDTIKQNLSEETVTKLAGAVGLSPADTKSGLTAAVPVMLTGLLGASATPEGARRVNEAAANQDDSVLANPSSLLSNLGAAGESEGPLGNLLGSSTASGLVGAVCRHTGLGQTAIRKLLAFGTPYVLALLGRQSRATGMDPAAILSSQRANITAALPSGLSAVLGRLSGMSSLFGAEAAAPSVSAPSVRPGAAMRAESSAMRWLLPVLGVVAVGLLLWWATGRMWRSEKAEPQVVKEPAAGPSAIPAIANNPDANRVLSEAKSLTSTISEQLGQITDPASAEASQAKLQEASDKLKALNTSLSALPAEVRDPVTKQIATLTDNLRPAADKAMAIPGVREKIQPTVDQLMVQVDTLAGRGGNERITHE